MVDSDIWFTGRMPLRSVFRHDKTHAPVLAIFMFKRIAAACHIRYSAQTIWLKKNVTAARWKKETMA